MKLALALLLLAVPAFAGDTAPMSALVEPAYRVSVFEVTCTDLGDCCGVHRRCGDWHVQRHNVPNGTPAPVPLPDGIWLLAAAIAALIWKGSKHARCNEHL